MKKKIWILTILATVLCIGGCSKMDKKETLTKEEQAAIKIEQDRMVEYLYKYYEDIQEVEFIEFKKNDKTGSWHAVALVNKDIYVRFSISGKLNHGVEFGFGEHSSKSNNQYLIKKAEIDESKLGIKNIKVKYFEGGEK